MYVAASGQTVPCSCHGDGKRVLCIYRFLDTRLFATCSDDHTVCLWDLRNMKQKVCLLRGHSDMVKNVEIVPEKGIILTSAFDGNINEWNINWYAASTCCAGN